MASKRRIICGDIHGCIEEFDELLRQVSFVQGSDELILLGDLMDRGPDPVGVVRRAQELNALSVCGNHDLTHLRWRANEEAYRLHGRVNGMRPLNDERKKQNEGLSAKDLHWLKGLPYKILLPNRWVAVHGGFQPNVPMFDQKNDKIVRMRMLKKESLTPASQSIGPDNEVIDTPDSIFWALVWKGPENVVYGHAVQGDTPFHNQVEVEPPFEKFRDSWPKVVHTVGLDTGAVFGGNLTAMISTDDMLTWEYSQVRAKREYYAPNIIWHKAPPWR